MKNKYKTETQLALVAKSNEWCASKLEYFHKFKHKSSLPFDVSVSFTNIKKGKGWVLHKSIIPVTWEVEAGR